MFKRITDLVIATLAGVIVIPIILICAVAVKLESEGPAFFLQHRSGRGGRIFKIYKLRTMVTNASKIGPILTQKNDPRITKVGAFLRRSSFDELPQLINVFRGEMSIVGPRPEVPEITDTYSDELKEVLNWKPGMTGISQVNGRAALEIEEKVQMEIAYQRKANFFTDLLVILKTPWVMITNKGNVM